MTAKQFAQDAEDRRRQQLIEATYVEVAEKGYSAVTLQDIATRAGVSKGATLYYFASKEDLFLGAWEWKVAQIHAQLRAAIAQEEQAIAKLHAMLNVVFCNAQVVRQFFLAYSDFVSLGARNKRFYDLNARFYQGCSCHNQEIIELGIQQGVFRQVNADDAWSMMRALVDGLLMQWFFSAEATLEQYQRRCERVILAYLTGELEAARLPAISVAEMHC